MREREENCYTYFVKSNFEFVYILFAFVINIQLYFNRLPRSIARCVGGGRQ